MVLWIVEWWSGNAVALQWVASAFGTCRGSGSGISEGVVYIHSEPGTKVRSVI